MDITAKLDEIGKPAWIGLMIVGFIVFWPIGLGILGYLIWSGRMGCSRHAGPGRWWNMESQGCRPGRRHGRHREASGNAAFDEYREETLRRLEEEQGEFMAFLERLRQAKDKAEFDQFMADRGRPRAEPDEETQAI